MDLHLRVVRAVPEKKTGSGSVKNTIFRQRGSASLLIGWKKNSPPPYSFFFLEQPLNEGTV